MPDTLWGGLEGFRGERNPSTQFPARTQASDGHCVSTRAARSASIRFAVRSLSKAIDREITKVRRLCWHLIHRGAVPLPLVGEGFNPLEVEARLRVPGATLAYFGHLCISARTLREGERVCRSPHPPRSGPPSPQGEGQDAAYDEAWLPLSSTSCYRRPHPPLSRSPFRTRHGFARPTRRRLKRTRNCGGTEQIEPAMLSGLRSPVSGLS